MEKKLDNKVKKKKHKKLKIVIITIVVILLLIIGICAFFIWSKLSKMKIEKIDKSDLDVNNQLYEDVDGLTQKEFNNVINVALFGSDSRDTNNMYAGRSDTIMIASLNPKYNSIKLISIPRDTYVNVPGYGKTKINHAYAYGGEQLGIKTLNNNFGLNITEYITVDFSGLINIINDVDGIEMDITKSEMDVINQYLTDSYKITGKKYTPMTKYGHVTLNGEQALAHSRNRYVGSDFTRANRQRDVLIALMNKVSKMGSKKIFSLIDTFLSQVKTNINVASYTGTITDVIANMGEYTKNVISTQIPATGYSAGQTIDGVYYYVTDLQKAKEEFVTYLYEK